jgi:hypothetical protein
MRVSLTDVLEDVKSVALFLVRDAVIVVMVGVFLWFLKLVFGFFFSDNSQESVLLLRVFAIGSDVALILLYFGLAVKHLIDFFRSERRGP